MGDLNREYVNCDYVGLCAPLPRSRDSRSGAVDGPTQDASTKVKFNSRRSPDDLRSCLLLDRDAFTSIPFHISDALDPTDAATHST